MIHILGLPHTKISKKYSTCAFTQKIIKMCKILDIIGEQYQVYAPGGDDGFPIVKCMNDKKFKSLYGNRKEEEMYDRDNKNGWNIFNDTCIKKINKTKKAGDILFVTYGDIQDPVVKGVNLTTIEMGIGYTGTINGTFKVFESYALLNYVLGKYSATPNDYYEVIPNYYDLEDFKFKQKKQDYICFIGRLNNDKGPQVAVDVAKKLGIKIKVAGQLGDRKIDPYCEYVGVVDFKQRQSLVSNAMCLMAPSQYVEPFGGVVVESLLYGTPIITSDNGGFQEINQQGITGFRCKSLWDYVEAVISIGSIDPLYCRKYAESNYSLESVAKKYRSYLEKIKDYQNGGDWYKFTTLKSRDDLTVTNKSSS